MRRPLQKTLMSFLTFVIFCSVSLSQKVITLNEAVQMALTNHPSAKNADLKVEAAKASVKGFPYFSPAEFYYIYGQTHSAIYNKYYGVTQNLGSPFTVYRNLKLGKEQVTLFEKEKTISIKQLTATVKSAYMDLLYFNLMSKQTRDEVELSGDFEHYYPDSVNMTDAFLLEKAEVQSIFADVQRRNFLAEEELSYSTNLMKQLLCTKDTLILSDTTMELYAIAAFNLGTDKFYPVTQTGYFEQIQKVKICEVGVERSKLTPEIEAGYFNQEIGSLSGFKGFTLGITIPLFFNSHVAKIKEAEISRKITQNELEYQKLELLKTIENLKIRLNQYFVNISYYRENALIEADVLINFSLKMIAENKISYHNYLKNITKAFNIKKEYLDALKLYNETAIDLERYIN
jgi:heavy metal efflux system protein